MALADHIEKVKGELRSDVFPSEAAVSLGILLPALHELGWPVFNTHVVAPEFAVEGRRVDYALCHPANKPAVFVEVKRVGRSDRDDKQLFEYAFHQGVPMAILTDGQEWSFYLPAEQGRYDERRVYKLDLLERNIEDAASRLERYLSYKRVCSGEALKAAREDYQTVARKREIDAVLPKAWSALLEERDSLLLELLADKVEDLCGYKPASDVCGQFLAGVSKPHTAPPVPAPGQFSSPLVREVQRPQGVHTRAGISFAFRGERHECSSAAEVMRRVFRLLAEADPAFLERFASLNHGQKRRYLDRDRQKLYPGKPPDFAETKSFEVAPGWWLGTNYNRKNIREILDLALGVAHPRLRSEIRVNINSAASAPTRSVSLPVREHRRPQGVRRTGAADSFAFRGQTHECNSAREVLRRVFELLAREDPDFCEKFARMPRTHRYLARDQGELYPAQPRDFAEKNSAEIAPGWWLGINHGRDRIRQILSLALEVAHPRLRAVIQINIGA